MPRINPDDYLDYDDDDLEIQNDEPRDRAGRRPNINKPTRQDLDWEERRRQLQRNKQRKSQDL